MRTQKGRQNGSTGDEWVACSEAQGYEVSRSGRVRKGKRLLRAFYSKGHFRVCVCCPRPKHVRVAALVAQAFLGLERVGLLKTEYRLLHRDGDRSNCRAANLLLSQRRYLSRADLERAMRLRASGNSYAFIAKVTGVPCGTLYHHLRKSRATAK